MNFLKYVEHSAENLQFYLWFKGYIKRFEDLPEGERILSPEWTQQQEDAENLAYRNILKQKPLAAEAADILRAQNLAPSKTWISSEEKKQESVNDSRDFLNFNHRQEATSLDGDIAQPTGALQFVGSKITHGVEVAFDDAGCKLQPCKD
jgi:hypothetical protein